MEPDVSGEGCRQRQENILKTFIDIYKSLPELWDPGNISYTNKYRRLEAQDKLLEIYKRINERANRMDVRKKINTLRSNYNKEVAKIKNAEAEGREYVPRNWVFHELRFLDGIKKPDLQIEFTENEESFDVGNEQEIKSESCSFPAMFLEIEQNQDTVMEKPCNKPTPVNRIPKAKPKSINPRTNHKERLNKRLMTPLNLFKPPSSLSSSGIEPVALVWSSKLQTLRPTQRLLAEKAINDILFEASLNNLDKGPLTINACISSVSHNDAEGYSMDEKDRYIEYATSNEDE